MRSGLSTTWTRVAALTALAIGPACNADFSDSRASAELETEEDEPGQRPATPTHELTTYDHDAVVPGFAVAISLGGETGEDVVLDWSASGFSGDVMVYRSTDANALLEISIDEPLAPGVDGTSLFDETSFIDIGAASHSVETPHYFYRVGFVQYTELGTQLQLSTMVMKTTTATSPGYNTFGMCMLDGPSNPADLYDRFGDSVVAVWGWDAVAQTFINWNPVDGGEIPLPYGSSVMVEFDQDVADYHSLVGLVPTNEALTVSGQPGDNWMAFPVFFDGPTNASYWVDDVHFWGVGEWSNDNQAYSWYWGPEYADFDLEPCGAYQMYLPPNGCSSDEDCNPDQRCYFEEAAGCGDVIAGLCYTPPDDCGEQIEVTPICGCDGITYNSPCEAYAAGTSVQSPGSGGGGGIVVFDFEAGSPVLEATGDWQLYGAAPPSYSNPETPFSSQVFGTDGNRVAPYPGDDNENSFATLGPITLGESLSLRSWHVDEGGDYYDRKRIYFEADTGESWLLVDCTGGINLQTFCEYREAERAGDDWDQIALDTAILSGQTGTLRFEYQTLDGCCSFEQGWFIDDIALDGCSVELTSGPPIPAPAPDECPAQCLELAMFQQLVLDADPGPIDSCYMDDYGSGGSAQINGGGGTSVLAYWDDFGSGQCNSSSPELGYQSYQISNTQAAACGDLIEAQIAALGPACNGGAESVCGNGFVEPGEQCDGGDLQGQSCGSLGLGAGPLACEPESCTFDTAACVPLGGGGGGSCEGGNDPFSADAWVVCSSTPDEAWVSHANAGGGQFHPELICASLGYSSYGAFGGTCGNVCGYCEGATSCEATGAQTYDGSGDCGTDANGQLLCVTVQWQCLNAPPA